MVNGLGFRWTAWRHDLSVELADVKGQRLTVRLFRDKINPWLEINTPEELKKKRRPGEMGEVKKDFVERAIHQCLRLGWRPEVRLKPIVAQFKRGRFNISEPRTEKD